MKPTRHILFVAGLIGLIGMFIPLVSLGKGVTHVEVSAKELSFGLSRTHSLLEKEIPPSVRKRMPRDILQAREDVRTVLKGLRGAAAAYIPALAILLCGVAVFWRGWYGRKLAAGVLFCGVASIVAYFAVIYGIDYGKNEEPLLHRVNLQVELGAYFLIVAGIGGMLGGVLGLIKPETAPKPRATTPPPLAPPPTPPPPGPATY